MASAAKDKIEVHEKIYKKDSKGRIRTWHVESVSHGYRTVTGVLGEEDFKKTAWTYVKPRKFKTVEEQNEFRIGAMYRHKLDRDYFTTAEEAQGGPRHFKPMLAQKYKKFVPGFAQPKLDGIRCIATSRGLFSRQGKQITSCEHISHQLAPLFLRNESIVLDGELYNHNLNDDFNQITSLVKKQKPSDREKCKIADIIQYHVYDIGSSESQYTERRQELTDLIRQLRADSSSLEWTSRSIVDVATVPVYTEEQYNDFHEGMVSIGYEGSILRTDDFYQNKRTKSLLKRKEFFDAEFKVVKINEGKGEWAGCAKSVSCVDSEGRKFDAGIRGTKERARKLLSESHSEVTVRYPNLTPRGVPRFGVVVEFHGKGREL